MSQLQFILDDIFYFLSLEWLEEKHHLLRLILLNLVYPLIVSIPTSLLTTMLLMKLLGL